MEAASVHTLPDDQDVRGDRRIVDRNGELRAAMPTTLEDAWDMIEGLLAKEAQGARRETRLKNMLEEKRAADIEKKAILEVLTVWRDTCAKQPQRVRLVRGNPRWEKVRERLREGWSVEDLKLVPAGALHDPWPGRSEAMAGEILFRDTQQVEKFVALAEQANDAAFEQRLAEHHAKHPSVVYDEIERERQVSELARLDPSVFLPESGEVAAEVVRFEGRTG